MLQHRYSHSYIYIQKLKLKDCKEFAQSHTASEHQGQKFGTPGLRAKPTHNLPPTRIQVQFTWKVIPGHICRGVGKWSGRKKNRGCLIEPVTILDNHNLLPGSLEIDLEHKSQGYSTWVVRELWHLYDHGQKTVSGGVNAPVFPGNQIHELSGLMWWWKAPRQRKAGAGSRKSGVDYGPRRLPGHKQYLLYSTRLYLSVRFLRYAFSSELLLIGPTIVVELKEIYTKSLRYCHVFQTWKENLNNEKDAIKSFYLKLSSHCVF